MINRAPTIAGELRFGLGGFLLHALFGPWRNGAVLAGVGDGLAKVFAEMSGGEKEGAADGGVLAKHFQRVVQVGVLDGENCSAEMREGVFEGLNGLRLIACGGIDSFGVEAGGQRRAEYFGNAVIGG